MLKIRYQNPDHELSGNACEEGFTNHPFKEKMACPYPHREKTPKNLPRVLRGLAT